MERTAPDGNPALGQKLRGHFGYYGITGSPRALGRFAYELERIWHGWLARRTQRGMHWDRFHLLLRRYPLPSPRVVHGALTSNAASL